MKKQSIFLTLLLYSNVIFVSAPQQAQSKTATLSPVKIQTALVATGITTLLVTAILVLGKTMPPSPEPINCYNETQFNMHACWQETTLITDFVKREQAQTHCHRTNCARNVICSKPPAQTECKPHFIRNQSNRSLPPCNISKKQRGKLEQCYSRSIFIRTQ